MTEYPLVSVYTCVFNGERTIHRVFKSMKELDYPNIEHVIINDGSTDKTEELVQEYMRQVPFVVKYHKKNNGGKHTALNIVWDLAEGEFMIQLDADDELLPHSVRYLVDTYFQIPENVRDEYWCIHGRCITQKGDFVGDKYPDDINVGHWSETCKKARNYGGEKIGLQVRKYLRNFKFPEVVGVSYIPESIVWQQINKEYGTWYTNEIVRVYYVGEHGNLTDKITKRRQVGPKCYRYKWKIMHPQWFKISIKDLAAYSVLYFITDKRFRDNNGYLKDIKKHKLALVLLYPIAITGALFIRTIKGIR